MVTLYAKWTYGLGANTRDCAIKQRLPSDYLSERHETLLKVHNDPAIEIKVEDEGTTVSVDIVEPERLGQLVQQFRDLMS